MKKIIIGLLFAVSVFAQSSGVGTINTYITGTLQNAVTGNGNGTALAVAGLSSALFTVNCSVACTGGTTITFQGSDSLGNYVPIIAQQANSSLLSSTVVNQGTTVTIWQANIAGMTNIRTPISAYSTGTITVTVAASVIPFSPSGQSGGGSVSGTVTTTTGSNVAMSFAGMTCLSIEVTGTWTGTLTPQQANSDGNWTSIDTLQQSIGQAPSTIGNNGKFYLGAFGALQVRVAGPTSTGSAVVTMQSAPGTCGIQYVANMAWSAVGYGIFNQPVTFTSAATSSVDVVQGYNEADVFLTLASITGSPAGCTIQPKVSYAGATFVTTMSPQPFTAANGTIGFVFSGAFGLAPEWYVNCATFPSAGTVSLSVVYKAGGSGQVNATYNSTPPLPAAGNVTPLQSDGYGNLLVLPYGPTANYIQTGGSATGTGSTAIFAAAGSGIRNYATSCSVTNTSATNSYVSIENGSTVIDVISAPANGGAVKTYPTPLRTAANAALNFVAGVAATTIYVYCQGFTGL